MGASKVSTSFSAFSLTGSTAFLHSSLPPRFGSRHFRCSSLSPLAAHSFTKSAFSANFTSATPFLYSSS